MDIRINSVKFSATSELEHFISSKLSKLALFNNDIIGAEVFLRLDNNQTKENKITEIKLELPGNEVFVKKQSKSFEESTDSACQALKKQVTKFKEKQLKV